MIAIIQKKKIWLTIALVMFIIGVLALSIWKLKFGIDFTGGSILSVEYKAALPSHDQLNASFAKLDIKEVEIKPTGEHEASFKFKTVDEATHQKVLEELRKAGEVTEKSFDSVGPVIGGELAKKTIWAIIIALLAILAYVSYVFRKVSRPVESWKYGAAAIIALLHDVTFVLGIFAILGHFAGVEVSSSFIAAFLTVLGFSVHDTIVVFDRIRENLMKSRGDFEETVNRSINETIARSINTSFTVLLVLAAIFFFGGESLHVFSLALFLGIAVGTYSSIFVASPLLVLWYQMKKKA